MKLIKRNIKTITIITLLLITISLIGLKYYLINTNNKKLPEENNEIIVKEEDIIEEPKKISVDIKGEVKKPGVYEIEEDKLIIDVINIAEGLTENADTTLINLAKKVTNEMVIIIYNKEEVKKALEDTTNNSTIAKIIDKKCICPSIKNDGCITNESQKNNNENKKEETKKEETTEEVLVNINTATKEELEKIPGIGSSKAESIIKYREESGLFNSIEDIKNVTGIGDSLYEKIKNYITV